MRTEKLKHGNQTNKYTTYKEQLIHTYNSYSRQNVTTK